MAKDIDFSARYGIAPGKKLNLAKTGPNEDGGLDGKAAVSARLDECRERLHNFQVRLYAERKRAVLVCLQGMDSSGKDSVINHVFSAVDLMGCEVTSFKKPSELEMGHDFLWRHHQAMPARGMIGLHNRSHYEAVVIERVQKIVDDKTCKRRIAEINAFELMLSNAGTTIIKFFLHISKDEQLVRFKARLDDPLKHWKIGEADFDQRERWDDNIAAYEDAIAATSTAHAPWYVIPANRKWYRDLAISEIMTATLEKLAIPQPEPQADMDKLRKRYRTEEAAGVAALKAKK